VSYFAKPVIDHRIYTIRLRKMGEFIEVFDRLAMPILLQTLGHPLGFWTSLVGPQNQFVHLWGYDSLAHYEQLPCARHASRLPGLSGGVGAPDRRARNQADSGDRVAEPEEPLSRGGHEYNARRAATRGSSRARAGPRGHRRAGIGAHPTRPGLSRSPLSHPTRGRQACSSTCSTAWPADVSKALRGATFDTLYGQVTMRAQDKQLVLPSYAARVKAVDGQLRPVIEQAFPATLTPPSPLCKM
jgi:hypothetical protein